mmetsp:Transcript_110787/g.247228  ORF Transcript_110787/g.247228 Transcript_110787/m.247228 type:complete len:519 (+) Transcript_110787:73-1629(+)
MSFNTLLVAVALANIAWGRHACAPGTLPDQCDIGVDDTGLLQSRAVPGLLSTGLKENEMSNDALHWRKALLEAEKASEPCSNIGVLMMSGYAWPTQPGDINDLRTFCRVEDTDVDTPNYSCKLPYKADEFGIVTARIENLTFDTGRQGVENFTYNHNSPLLIQTMKPAVMTLLADPTVCAIVGNVGFMSHLGPAVDVIVNQVEKQIGQAVKRKPTLLGTPALAPLIAQAFYDTGVSFMDTILKKDSDRVLIVASAFSAFNTTTSNAEQVNQLCELMRNIGVSEHGLKGLNCTKFEATFFKPGNFSTEKLITMLKEEFPGIKIPPGHVLATVRELGAITGSMALPPDLLRTFIRKQARSILPIGWNNISGYTAVDTTAGFHNTWRVQMALNASSHLYVQEEDVVGNALSYAAKHNLDVQGFVMESTEMPSHSNFLRQYYNKPVWDVSTLGICLMRAGRSGDFHDIEPNIAKATLNSHTFQSCMLEWWDAGKLEPKFGNQPDHKLKWFDQVPDQELPWLE